MQPGRERSIWPVVSASMIGSALEWFDFFIYGIAAALVFNELFFPQFDPLFGTIVAFATMAAGSFARPLGGIVFGNLGDKLGRISILVTTLLLMGIATTMIGLLPTYEQIGIWAPILLLLMRLIQGFGAGAEYGGAVVIVAEYAPRSKRGFYASFPATGVALGILLSSGIFQFLTTLLSQQQFMSWGWRIPFLLSSVLVVVGLFLRLRVLETPAFRAVEKTDAKVRVPVLTVIRTQPKSLLVAIGARFSENGNSYLIQTFAITFVVQHLGMSEDSALMGSVVGSTIALLAIPAYGALSDRIGRRPVFLAGTIFIGLFAFPFFWLLETQSYALIAAAIAIGILGKDAMFAAQPAYYCELFDTRVRYSGFALAREVASPFAGGISPLVATTLLAWSGSYWPIALYMILLALISAIAVYLGPETYQRDLSEDMVGGRADVRPTSSKIDLSNP